jgi:hypothetical protein
MELEHHLTFGPFRLDTMHGRVWRGVQVTTLRLRSLAMLRYLVEHPGRLVTKAELRQDVWAGTHVTDTVLRVSVQAIRAALSLSRLWQQQSRQAAAHALLAPIYGWFTEGFDPARASNEGFPATAADLTSGIEVIGMTHDEGRLPSTHVCVRKEPLMKRTVVLLTYTLGVGIMLGLIWSHVLNAQQMPVKRTVLLENGPPGARG